MSASERSTEQELSFSSNENNLTPPFNCFSLEATATNDSHLTQQATPLTTETARPESSELLMNDKEDNVRLDSSDLDLEENKFVVTRSRRRKHSVPLHEEIRRSSKAVNLLPIRKQRRVSLLPTTKSLQTEFTSSLILPQPRRRPGRPRKGHLLPKSEFQLVQLRLIERARKYERRRERRIHHDRLLDYFFSENSRFIDPIPLKEYSDAWYLYDGLFPIDENKTGTPMSRKLGVFPKSIQHRLSNSHRKKSAETVAEVAKSLIRARETATFNSDMQRAHDSTRSPGMKVDKEDQKVQEMKESKDVVVSTMRCLSVAEQITDDELSRLKCIEFLSSNEYFIRHLIHSLETHHLNHNDDWIRIRTSRIIKKILWIFSSIENCFSDQIERENKFEPNQKIKQNARDDNSQLHETVDTEEISKDPYSQLTLTTNSVPTSVPCYQNHSATSIIRIIRDAAKTLIDLRSIRDECEQKGQHPLRLECEQLFDKIRLSKATQPPRINTTTTSLQSIPPLNSFETNSNYEIPIQTSY